ncbi:MAG TPA: class I SAM-dependent methyltransferase [Flavobacteriales bacterium]|nr:class I SAM-dependent methyltransferase [Flavobacteriales bacterium]
MKLAEGTFQGLHGLEVDLFRRILKGVGGYGVEIGCCDGFSSAVILEASDLHLTSIDPFIPDSMEASLVGSKERYYENMEQFGNRAKLFFNYSTYVAIHDFFDIPPMDFLFIDGDHSLQGVQSDFGNWTPHLKTGGILAMHDARMGRDGSPNFHEGPSKVARERVFARPGEWEVIGEAFTLVIARKL